MVPTVAVKNANAPFQHIGFAVPVDKAATGAGTVGAEAGIYFWFKISKFFQ